MLSETEELVFKKIKQFIDDEDRQNLIRKYEEEQQLRAKKRRILMNYGNGEFEPVSTSTLDTYILKEVMDLFQSIMSPRVGSEKFASGGAERKAKHQEEDELESTEVENIESVPRIQNL